MVVGFRVYRVQGFLGFWFRVLRVSKVLGF